MNTKEPIKTNSQQWMIDNFYHPPLVTPVNFAKTEQEKQELKLEKKAYKAMKDTQKYYENRLVLASEIAKSHPRFNISVIMN